MDSEASPSICPDLFLSLPPSLTCSLLTHSLKSYPPLLLLSSPSTVTLAPGDLPDSVTRVCLPPDLALSRQASVLMEYTNRDRNKGQEDLQIEKENTKTQITYLNKPHCDTHWDHTVGSSLGYLAVIGFSARC